MNQNSIEDFYNIINKEENKKVVYNVISSFINFLLDVQDMDIKYFRDYIESLSSDEAKGVLELTNFYKGVYNCKQIQK